MPVSDSNLIFRSGLPPFACVVRLISCRIYNFVIGGPNHTPFPLSRLQVFFRRPFFLNSAGGCFGRARISFFFFGPFSSRTTHFTRTNFERPPIGREKVS